MDEAITVGTVVYTLLAVAGVGAVLLIAFAVLAFMASGWDH